MKTNKLLDKIVKKNYNNQLEEVLAKKEFDEEVKNLLLDILYKIENAYDDYTKVKYNTLTREEYIQKIIQTIENDCNKIRFIKQEEIKKNDDKTCIVDKANKEIVCLPIERKLLYCLAKMEKKNNIVKSQNDILNRTLTNTLNIGNNINTLEPFRDFNGFSWNISTLEIENIYYNLIYQDLIILVGNRFLEDWTNNSECKTDYTELFEHKLEVNFGKEFEKRVFAIIKKLSILIEINIDNKFKNKMQEKEKELKQILDKMNNKSSYLEEISESKKEIAKRIRRIDLIINDADLLQREYKKVNAKLPLEKKVFSIRVFSKNMKKEREKLLKQMENFNELMNPKNFRQKREDFQEQYFYVSLVNLKDIENEIMKDIILLQKEVLKALREKTKNAKEKADLLKVFYELRYFNLLPVSIERNVSQVKELSKLNTMIKKEILNKAYELKLIDSIFQDQTKDFQIFKNIFVLQIISLEDIQFKICEEKENYYVQFFDEEVIDEKFKLNFSAENKNEKTILKKFSKKNQPIFNL